MMILQARYRLVSLLMVQMLPYYLRRLGCLFGMPSIWTATTGTRIQTIQCATNVSPLTAGRSWGRNLGGRRTRCGRGAQQPWATILTCADSRISPELVFGGLNLGELFVCSNAGNRAGIATMGSIEYGAAHLASPLVVVLGHEMCGAVTAACDVAVKGTKLPGSIGPMVDAILPAAKRMMCKEGDFIDNVVRESAKMTAEAIGQRPIIGPLVAGGKVKVIAAR